MKITSYAAKYVSIAFIVSVALVIVFLAHYTSTASHQADLGGLFIVLWGGWAWWRTDRDLTYEQLKDE